MKKCKVCGEEKPFSEYYTTNFKSKENPDKIYYHGKCKKCYIKLKQEEYTPEIGKNKNLLHKYGITLEDYNNLLKKQDYKCDICHSAEPGGRKSGRGGSADVFVVDHSHNTGKIRGLLCHRCNRGMGLLGDNINLLEETIKYLKKHQDSTP